MKEKTEREKSKATLSCSCTELCSLVDGVCVLFHFRLSLSLSSIICFAENTDQKMRRSGIVVLTFGEREREISAPHRPVLSGSRERERERERESGGNGRACVRGEKKRARTTRSILELSFLQWCRFFSGSTDTVCLFLLLYEKKSVVVVLFHFISIPFHSDE